MPMALCLPGWPAIPLVSKDLLQYLWLIAACHAQLTCSGLVPSSVLPVSNAHCSASAFDSIFKACRALLCYQIVHDILIRIYEAVISVSFAGPMLFKHILSIGLSFLLCFHLGLAACPSWSPCLCRPPTPLSSSSLRSQSPSPSLLHLSPARDLPPAIVLLIVLHALLPSLFKLQTLKHDAQLACLLLLPVTVSWPGWPGRARER
jgi:hypothetical protein